MKNNLGERAVVFARPYIKQGLDKSRSTQLPFQAHTSNNAKLGIGASLFFGVLAFVGVAALVGHGVAKHTVPEYRKASDKAIAKLERGQKEAKKQAKEIKRQARKVIDEKSNEAREVVRDVKAKVEETAEKAGVSPK